MSDETKNPVPETPEAADDALNNEIQGLRDLFQAEWDKSVAEAQEHPPIQALDYTPEEDEEEEDGADEEKDGEEEPAPEESEKPKKEKKKRGKALLVVLIVLLVLILIPLITYFVISIKVPNFNNFISAYANSLSAEGSDAKIAYLEEALDYCGEGTVLEKCKQTIYEDLTVLKCETDGYAAALSYMQSNMTEEMLAKPESKEFKEFLQIGEKVGPIADGAYEAVSKAYDKAGDNGIDYGAVADELGTPAMIKNDVVTALKSIGSAIEAEHADAETFDIETVITGYLTAVQNFKTLGADAQGLLEQCAVKLYDNGNVYETTVLLENYFDEDMLKKAKTEAFAGVLEHIDALKNVDADIYGVTKNLFDNNNTTPEEIKNALGLTLPDAETNVLVDVARTIVQGMECEKAKDIPNAQIAYNDALNVLTALGLDADALAGRLINIDLLLGDEQSAYQVRSEAFGEDTAFDDEELAATVEKIDAIYAAVTAGEEVFYPYYSNYYYGTELDKEALNADLDALLTEDADEYLTAYVNYFKFFGENFTDSDTDTMAKYLEEYKKPFADYPAFYASLLGEIYKMQGKFDKVEAIADEVLAQNVADDYANSVKSMVRRVSLNVDEALEIAEKGVELSGGQMLYCAREAVICCLLKEDYETAIQYAAELFDSSLTYDNVEYIMLITSFYDGDDPEVQAMMDDYRAQADQVYDSYGIELGEKAQALIDGTTTMVKVFLEAPYYLR